MNEPELIDRVVVVVEAEIARFLITLTNLVTEDHPSLAMQQKQNMMKLLAEKGCGVANGS